MKGRSPKLIEEILDYRYKEMAQSVTLTRAKNKPEQVRKFNDHAMDDMRYALTFIKRYDVRQKDENTQVLQFIRKMKKGFINKPTRGYMVA